MVRLAFLLISLVAFGSSSALSPTIDRNEAREAYLLLNQIRANPRAFAKELNLDPRMPLTKAPLHWNDTLARIAEARAYDMATRDYFDHTDPDGNGVNYHINRGGYWLNPDWLKDRRANNFESIAANYETATAGIKSLILGKNSPMLFHRKHLLGMDEWNHTLHDIGIGFVRRDSGSQYKTYLCVIIAKHTW